jgi:hypothetical protein
MGFMGRLWLLYCVMRWWNSKEKSILLQPLASTWRKILLWKFHIIAEL